MSARQCGGCERKLRDAYLCAACAAELGKLYDELPGLVEELITTVYRQDKVAAPAAGRGSGVRPLPFKFAASRLLDDLTRHIAAIARRHMVAAALIDPPGQPPIHLCRDLAARLKHDRVSLPEVAETLSTLARDVAAIRVMIDLPASFRYLGRCEACGGEMYADRAAARHECATRDCPASYEVAARITDLIERSRSVVASGSTIVTALSALDHPVSEEQIHKWRQRGRLAVIEYVGPQRRPRYRVGDVIDLIAASAARTRRPR